jgi:hypothetical protein
MLANGQEVGTMTSGQPIGQMLYEFLAERGDGGWEVVGMAGVRDGTEIVLKRPLQELEETTEE